MCYCTQVQNWKDYFSGCASLLCTGIEFVGLTSVLHIYEKHLKVCIDVWQCLTILREWLTTPVWSPNFMCYCTPVKFLKKGLYLSGCWDWVFVGLTSVFCIWETFWSVSWFVTVFAYPEVTLYDWKYLKYYTSNFASCICSFPLETYRICVCVWGGGGGGGRVLLVPWNLWGEISIFLIDCNWNIAFISICFQIFSKCLWWMYDVFTCMQVSAGHDSGLLVVVMLYFLSANQLHLLEL